MPSTIVPLLDRDPLLGSIRSLRLACQERGYPGPTVSLECWDAEDAVDHYSLHITSWPSDTYKQRRLVSARGRTREECLQEARAAVEKLPYLIGRRQEPVQLPSDVEPSAA